MDLRNVSTTLFNAAAPRRALSEDNSTFSDRRQRKVRIRRQAVKPSDHPGTFESRIQKPPGGENPAGRLSLRAPGGR